MEKQNNTASMGIDPMVTKELGPESLENIHKLSTTIKTKAQEQKIEAHLILVGGNVKPEKRGRPHKDVNLILYSPQLATEIFSGGEHPRFNAFASFISAVARKLEWGTEIVEP